MRGGTTASPECDWELRVLGTLQLRCVEDASPNALLDQPKRSALLVYLALANPGRPIPRERIMSLFWPEADAERARMALRQSLSFLRSHLGKRGLVNTHNGDVSLAHRAIWCDAIVMESLIDEGRLEDGVGLYAGDLLDGYAHNVSHAFEEWVEGRRRALRASVMDAAWELAESYLEARDVVGAAYWAKRAHGFYPFDEPGVQRLMTLLDEVGDRTGALRAYRGLKNWLWDEFQIAPSPETERICTHVRSRTSVSAVAKPPRRSERDRRRTDRRTDRIPVDRDRREGMDRRRKGDRRSGMDRRLPD